jgi:ribosomal protein L40E
MEIIFPIFLLLIVWAIGWALMGSKSRNETIEEVNYFVKNKVKCSECLAFIPKEAKKCMHCGSSLI